jgi:hypothetical protein
MHLPSTVGPELLRQHALFHAGVDCDAERARCGQKFKPGLKGRA